jgi:uncharacterized protein YcfJ
MIEIMIKKLFSENWRTLLGMTIGAIAGFLYWHQIGCANGTCMITSSPVNSTIYGTIMGGLVIGMFKKEKHINKEEKKQL